MVSDNTLETRVLCEKRHGGLVGRKLSIELSDSEHKLNYLVDAGLRDYPCRAYNAVFLTHHHKDHIRGLNRIPFQDTLTSHVISPMLNSKFSLPGLRINTRKSRGGIRAREHLYLSSGVYLDIFNISKCPVPVYEDAMIEVWGLPVNHDPQFQCVSYLIRNRWTNRIIWVSGDLYKLPKSSLEFLLRHDIALAILELTYFNNNGSGDYHLDLAAASSIISVIKPKAYWFVHFSGKWKGFEHLIKKNVPKPRQVYKF